MHKRTEVARVLGTVASQRIWRTVVFAGAMLGGAACGGKNGTPDTTPKVEAADPVAPADPAAAPADPSTTGAEPAMADPCAGAASANPCGAAADPCAAAANPCGASADPCSGGEADPCAGATTSKKRPRGKSSKPTGRGFVLA